MIDKELKEKKYCVGCFACDNICPVNCVSMVCDEEGFWYPNVDYSKCTKCGKCIDVCPVINKKEFTNNPVAYACINKNGLIRLDSSSGGMFTLITEKIIDDGGVVFGAAFNDEFEVGHIYVKTKEALEKFRGSKYVQSKIGKTYKEVKDLLESGEKVLFSGTPCQVAGLKSYLKEDYDNLFSIDIICHGVPSPMVWQKYISYRENIAGSRTKRISFRQKNDGWKKYSVSFQFQNDTEYYEPLDKDLYMNAFLKNLCLRPSCYDYNFKGIQRISDITLGDFWGIQNLVPEMDDDKGTSLIFINSEKGNLIFDKIKDKCKYKKVDIINAIKNNTAAIKSVNKNPNREIFFENFDIMPFDKLVAKYCLEDKVVSISKKIKRIITKIKRF